MLAFIPTVTEDTARACIISMHGASIMKMPRKKRFGGALVPPVTKRRRKGLIKKRGIENDRPVTDPLHIVHFVCSNYELVIFHNISMKFVAGAAVGDGAG